MVLESFCRTILSQSPYPANSALLVFPPPTLFPLKPVVFMKRLFRRISVCVGAVAAVVFAVGCGGDYEIREYVVPRESDEVVTSDALKSQFPRIPFTWQVPADWQVSENDQFSTAAWQTGPVAQEARITLSKLSAAAGLEQQIVRWRTQLNLETTTEEELAKSSTERKLGETTASFVDINNEEETILGLIVLVDETMWIFKYRAPNTTAKQTGDSFRKFVDGLQLAKSE